MRPGTDMVVGDFPKRVLFELGSTAALELHDDGNTGAHALGRGKRTHGSEIGRGIACLKD